MRKIISLNEGWQFSKDCATHVHNESVTSVNLPHTWNATDGQDGGNDYFRGSCLYTKKLLKSELPKALRWATPPARRSSSWMLHPSSPVLSRTSTVVHPLQICSKLC